MTQFAAMLGVTEQQCNAQLAKNKKQIKVMHEKAVKTGKKVNGYTAEQLEKLCAS